jgi:Spy/CpxP family protein refolding chaperone
MKKLFYIFVPLIALSLVASDAWSAKAPETGKQPGMEQQYGKVCPGHGGPGGMHEGKGPGNKEGSKLGIPRGKWWNRKGVQEKLKLTDEQIAKLEKISLEGRKTMIKQRSELEIVELELEPLMEAKKFDREKVENVLDKMEVIRAKMAKERQKTLLDTREVLTSEQFQNLKEMKGKRGERSGHGQKGSQHRAQR